MRLGELLGREVVTESGRRLGRVRDVQGKFEDGRLSLTGLIAGELGLLDRLGATGKRGKRGLKVPWERVLRVGREVVVRD